LQGLDDDDPIQPHRTQEPLVAARLPTSPPKPRSRKIAWVHSCRGEGRLMLQRCEPAAFFCYPAREALPAAVIRTSH